MDIREAMEQHVDLVKRDWASNAEVLLVRIKIHGTAYEIEPRSGSGWEPMLKGVLTDQGTDEKVSLDDDPVRFFDVLRATLPRTELYLSHLHDEEHCLFRSHDRFRLKGVPGNGRAIKRQHDEKSP